MTRCDLSRFDAIRCKLMLSDAINMNKNSCSIDQSHSWKSSELFYACHDMHRIRDDNHNSCHDQLRCNTIITKAPHFHLRDVNHGPDRDNRDELFATTIMIHAKIEFVVIVPSR